MGLDQWLIAKTTKRENKEENHTSVCGGLFGIIPTTVVDKVEIGYWRKAYDQQQLIYNIASKPENDEGNMLITREEVDQILAEAKRILETHKFDEEDGNDLTDDDPAFSSEEYTWLSKRKWEDTVKFFTEAKKIYEEDPDAEIFYHIWYQNMKTRIKINPDPTVVEEVRQALAANEGYCPCKLLHIPDNKCMCKDFRDQETGECHCGLYIKYYEDQEGNATHKG